MSITPSLPTATLTRTGTMPPALFRRLGSDRTVVASTWGIILDSNVITGGGTDQTAAFQTLLDLAQTWGRLRIILDGAIRISSTLRVYSNTTIECPSQDCGMFLANNSDVPMIRNATPTTNPAANGFNLVWPSAYTWPTRGSYAPLSAGTNPRPVGVWQEWGFDRNIAFRGGTYNANGPNQTHDKLGFGNVPEWVTNFAIHGCTDLRFEGVKLAGMRTYACYMTNVQRVWFTDCEVDSLTTSGINGDGIHFNGPARQINISGLVGRGTDDIIANSPNDLGVQASDGSPSNYGPYGGPGDITDISITDVTIWDSRQGIRFFTSTNRLDRVSLRGFKGYTRNVAIIIDCYSGWGPASSLENYSMMLPPGKGNVGSIVIDDINVDIRDAIDYHNCVIDIGCICDQVSISNIRRNGFVYAIPAVRVNHAGRVRSLKIDGLDTLDTVGHVTPQIEVLGSVESLQVTNATCSRAETLATNASSVLTIDKGRVGSLRLNNVLANGMHNVLNYNVGALRDITAIGVTHRRAGGNATFRLAGGRVSEMFAEGIMSQSMVSLVSPLGAIDRRRGSAFTVASYPEVLAESGFTGESNPGNFLATYVPEIGPAWTITAGNFYIFDYNLEPSTSNCAAVVECNASDVRITANTSRNNGFIQFRVRQVDEQNYIGCNIDGFTLEIFRVVANSATRIGGPVSFTASSNVMYPVVIVANGTSISMNVGGTTVSATTTQFQTATKHGWRTSTTAAKLDWFRVTTVPAILSESVVVADPANGNRYNLTATGTTPTLTLI